MTVVVAAGSSYLVPSKLEFPYFVRVTGHQLLWTHPHGLQREYLENANTDCAL